MRSMFVWITFGLACSTPAKQPVDTGEADADADADTDADADADTDADSDADSDADTDADRPAAWETVDRTLCDAVPGYEEVAGATTYYAGEYAVDSTGFSGREYWMVFPNPTWEALSGATDCAVVWQMVGEVVDPGACSACAFGIAFEASLDPSQTDCPEELYTGSENFSVTYAVSAADGPMTVYFAGSGNAFANGTATADGFEYLTEGTCSWFGR
jgi:hypothetical protein